MTILKAIISFPNVAVGTTATLPHTLNVDGIGQVPDKIEFTNQDFVVESVNTTDLIVRNNGVGTGSTNALVESWHTIERVFGNVATTKLDVQPFVPNYTGRTGIASNVATPEPPTIEWPAVPPTITTIYIRLGGSDTTGDGSLAKPYATFPRALADIPIILFSNTAYIVDCSGMGTINLPEPLTIPPYQGIACTWTDMSLPPWRQPLTSINIVAQPTVLDTIEASDVVAINFDPTTRLATIVTTKTWIPGAFEGKFVNGNPGVIGNYEAIHGNTATDLYIATAYAPDWPIQIVEPSTELETTGYAGVHLIGINCGLSFHGLKFTGGYGPGIYAQSCKRLNFTVCHLKSVAANNIDLFECQGIFIEGDGSMISDVRAYPFYCRGSYFKDTVFGTRFSDSDVGGHTFREIVFDGCNPVGPSVAHPDNASGTLTLYRALIRDGTSDGILYRGGFCGKVKNAVINDCVGNAIVAENSGNLIIHIVEGTGNGGIGMLLRNGVQVNRTGSSAPTGAGGDYKVGANAAVAGAGVGWAAFPGNETDIAAGSPQLCRLYT